MGKKSLVTQNLANGYPEWSRIRTDEQSVGQSFLNVIGNNMEPLYTELQRGYHNLYLSTANVSEIDLTYVFDLPSSFSFNTSVDNDSDLSYSSPTVSGLVGDTWYALQEVESGKISDFWYKAIASRVSISTTASGYSELAEITGDTLISLISNDILLDNHLIIEVSNGTSFYSIEGNTVHRAKIRLTGETWKGIKEEEEIVFLFNQTKKTNKIWTSISQVELINFPDDAIVKIYSHQFNLDHYPDHFNDKHQFSDSRDSMSKFWSLSDATVSGVRVLQENKYSVSNASDLLRNLTSIVPTRSWELVDSDNNPINALDIALIPYQQRAWITDGNKLYLYDLDWNQPDISSLTERTSAPLSRIITSSDYTIRDEAVAVDLQFVRPIKTLVRHRLKIKYPDGQEFGVDEDGSLVDPSTNYWVSGTASERFLRSTTMFEFSDYGEHLLTLECEYLGGAVEIDQRIILVDSKQPLATFNLDFTAVGLDVDHLHRLLILDTEDQIRQVDLHYDVMLIDYLNKEIICREPYDEIKVVK